MGYKGNIESEERKEGIDFAIKTNCIYIFKR